MKQDQLIVWWLTLKEHEDLPTVLLPKWIQRQLDSSKGRPGRGRLWVAPKFRREVEIPEDYWVGPLGQHCEHCTGIVLSLGDLHHLHGLPGTVTTLELRRVDVELLKEGVEEDD